jgi:hypothetical protein
MFVEQRILTTGFGSPSAFATLMDGPRVDSTLMEQKLVDWVPLKQWNGCVSEAP